MPTGDYIRAKYFEFADESPADADRSLAGSHWLRGAIMWFKAPVGSRTTDYYGNLLIRNGDASTGSTGDILFEIPVTSNFSYGNTQLISFLDSDSYIRFTDGFYLDQTSDAPSATPFDAFNFTILYS